MPYGDVDAVGFDAGPSHSGPGGPGGAGGLGTGTAEEVGALADALADALAGAQVDTFGSIAAEDQAAQDAMSGTDEDEADYAEDMSIEQERQDLADRIAEIDAAIAGSTEAGWAGPGTTDAASNPFAGGTTGVVDDFASGGYAAPGNQAGGMETFGFNPQHQTSPDFLEGNVNVDTFSGMPASAPAPMTGPETFSDYNQGVAQGYNFDQTQQGHPDFQGVQSVGTGVEDFTGMPGAVQAAPTSIEESEMGMAAPMGQGGMISAGQHDATMGATAGAPVMSGPQEASADQQGGLISAGAPATGTTEGGVYQDKIVRDAARPPEEVRQVATGTPEYHAIQKEQIDKSIMTMSEGLMAKAKADPTGIAIKGTNITNQRMANAFNSLDQYSKAYSASKGGSFLGSLISGAMPFGSAIKGIQGWLESKGMYSKQTGEDLFNLMKSAVDTGDLSQIVREIGGGGPSDEDVEGPKEVRSFIEQYPWASELDPKYIQYLIDNPPALQELLGQGAGGGDQQV